MIRPLYKKFNLEEAMEILDATRDMIVNYYNDGTIDPHHFHSMAEYVGYNLFVLYADKGLIDCKSEQISFNDVIYEETVKKKED